MPNHPTLLSQSISLIINFNTHALAKTPIILVSTLAIGVGSISLPAVAVVNTTPTSPATHDNAITYFPEITVTATRTPTLVSNTIAQTQVIDEEELQHYRGQTVLDVIKRQPGINIKQNGGIGTSSNFYMRGYDSKSVLVLIDGVRYSSISTGTPNLNLIPTEQIERIEILYGASGSSIYGSDAVGGVIQIFTKGENVEQSQFSATVGVGSHDQYLYGASAQFTNDSGTSLSLSASHHETDGINATLPTNTYNYNPDDDSYDSNNYSVRLTQNFGNDIIAGISGLYSESTSEYDSGAKAKDSTHADQKNGAAQAFVDWHYAPNASVKLSYGHSIDESDNFSSNPNTFDTEQQQFNLIGTQQLIFGQSYMGQAVYGAEHLTQSLDSNVEYDKDERKVNSAFLGYLINGDSYNTQANVRYDDYSDYGSETTYNLGAAMNFGSDFRVGANYAKGYRVPTFNDLYWPNSGNPDLNPETSDNYEVFLEYNTLLQSTRLTGYRNEVEDMIVYIYSPTPDNPYNGYMDNNDKAKIEGLTLTSDWYFDNYLVGFSYDYQKAKDESDYTGRTDWQGTPIDYNGNFLPFRPERKGLVYLGYQQPSFDIRAEYEHVSDYYGDGANSESNEVDSYGLLNISGNYQLTPHLSLNARINNLTNKDYVTIPNYNADGINYLMALTFTGY